MTGVYLGTYLILDQIDDLTYKRQYTPARDYQVGTTYSISRGTLCRFGHCSGIQDDLLSYFVYSTKVS